MYLDRIAIGLLAIAYLIVTILVLTRAIQERHPRLSGEQKVLRFPRTWRAWWYVTWCICAIGFSTDLLHGKVRASDTLFFWCVAIFFVVLFMLGTWFLIGYQVEYDDRRVTVRSLGAKHRTLQWGEAVGAEYKKGTGIVLTARSRQRLVIPSVLPGATELLELARSKVRTDA